MQNVPALLLALVAIPQFVVANADNMFDCIM